MLGLLLCLWFAPTLGGAQEATRDDLPPPVQIMLDAQYPGWNFAPIMDEVREFFKKERPGARANLIAGDFDGDGQTDYAAQIEHGIILDHNGAPAGHEQHLLAFMRRQTGYKLYKLTECGTGDHIYLAKKGDGGYDYEKQREITYERDAICTVIWEKGGSTYVFEKDHFRCFVSSD
ncbi:MAG: hypothetical protein ACJ74W_03780 [Pyrinomonadaceae bacterium]